MSNHKSPATFPWGEVLFPLGLIAAFLLYARNVYVDARGLTDWLLILPAALLGSMALLVIIMLKLLDWYRHLNTDLDNGRIVESTTSSQGSPKQALVFIGLLAAYVALIPHIGFDIGSFLFLFAALRLQGERRWWVLLSFSTAVAGIIVYLFVELLAVRMPTQLF
ncbi:tripartite tricarboxylate transporter TctB family protein [Halomonas sp. AOP42-D2-25]|uniref:tripartite tricarboxylate transporter TctB family protein n=1 Tax=Halomonas sp. AOP42-D2-25 TaxID=3457666 RepID=UPI0040344FD1